jgi:hypothetical protein
MSFAQFVDQVVERWVTGEMVAARAEWLAGLGRIVDAAEQQARDAAEHTSDGHIDVDVPQSFIDRYEAAVAQLGDSSGETRLRVQRQMFTAEAGGKKPTIV